MVFPGENSYPLKVMIVLIFLLLGSPVSVQVEAGEKEYDISSYKIQVTVDNAGDFLITEYIEYDFKAGEFTTAFREVSNHNFKGIKFKDLQGIDTEITEFQAQDGRNLEVSWEYPPREGKALFRLEYRGQEALKSREGQNIISWETVGQDWEVPIREAQVEIILPRPAEDLNYIRGGDPDIQAGNRLVFSREKITAGAGWHLEFNFREQVEMPELILISDYNNWMIPGLILAAFIVILRFLGLRGIMKIKEGQAQRQKAREFLQGSLDFPEKLFLYNPGGGKGSRALAALIFYLGSKNALQLTIKTSSRFLGKEKANLLISQKEYNPMEEKGIGDLKPLLDRIGSEKLKIDRIITRTGIWSKINRNLKQRQRIKNWVSPERKAVQRQSVIIGFAILVPAVAFFLDFFISDRVFTLVPGLFLGIIGSGELIRAGFIVPYNDLALTLQKMLREEVVERREKLEKLPQKEPAAALQVIFNQLPWLVLDEKMDSRRLKKIRNNIKGRLSPEEAEELEIPGWLAVEGLKGALHAIEVVEQTMIATIAAVSAASAASSSSSGGGSGGGGGAG